MKQSLPIDGVLPELGRVLETHNVVVLEAPPGAGKTTGVPPYLLNQAWLGNRGMIMLEPRRLAARTAASRIAWELDETVGQTAGYAIRFERKTGKNTRIEVVTEGILVKRMQNDPELSGVGIILFDEFHERSIHTDLGLAMALDIQSSIRPDLKLLVMSATLDGERIAAFLGNAPVVRSEGKSYHVTVSYAGRSESYPAQECARIVAQVVQKQEGDVLAFLPGSGDIRKARSLLEEKLSSDIVVHALYGDLSQKDQDAAIVPDSRGRRRIILATNIAETSLTIEGVRIVVDSGLAKFLRYDPRTGMSRLETGSISKASAVQRAGRAGRMAPGHCIRLYDEEEFRRMRPHTEPEILQADLSPLLLELAAWGTNPEKLRFLDPLPAAHAQTAYDLLIQLEALDSSRRITSVGRAMARLSLHPRLARMVHPAPAELVSSACTLAALLSERDVFRTNRSDRGITLSAPVDLRDRLRLVENAGGAPHGISVDTFMLERIRRLAREIGSQAFRPGANPTSTSQLESRDGQPASSISTLAGLLALAYPDRVAGLRSGSKDRYLLSNGKGAVLDKSDSLCGQLFLVVADLDGSGADAKIRLAMPISEMEIRRAFQSKIETTESTEMDEVSGRIVSFKSEMLGSLAIARKQIESTAGRDSILIEAVAKAGIDSLDWKSDAAQFCMRVELLRKNGFDLPELTRAWLSANLEAWLGPHLVGISRLSDVKRLNLIDILQSLLNYAQNQTLRKEAPESLSVPSGSHIRLEYSENDVVMAVKLQELFGLSQTPRIAGGKVPVTLHLLSPGMKPVQVTRDLENFWKKTYAEVRKELRGRYPRHPWPEDPATATPTKFAKRRGT